MADYQLLIFDWDGTLCDSIGRIVDSMRAAASLSGLGERSDEAIKGVIGLGLPEAIATLYPELRQVDRIEAFRQRYAEHYTSLEVRPAPLFGDVRESLESFRRRGLRTAVATGKSRRGLDRALAGHGWRDYFETSRCADETASKPDPLMLREILAHCGVRAEKALMVGDSVFDLDMARRAGIDSVAVGYGAQSRAVLMAFAPKLAIDEFSELRRWLEGDANCSPIEEYENVG